MPQNTNHSASEVNQVDKIRKLLQLCFLQAKLAVNANEEDVDNLISRFTRLVELEQELRSKMTEGDNCEDNMAELRQLISFIITDFQFFDRLKQQISNAVDPIKAWTETGELPDPFSSEFVNSYTTEQEKDIYRIAMEEDSIDIAEQQIAELRKNQVAHDDDALLF